MDVSLLCQFATSTFRYHLRRFATWTVRHLDGSPPGWFATWTVRHLDGSPPGWFATWKFCTFGRFDTRTFRYLCGRFATCLKICNLRYCNNLFVVRWRNVQGGSERNVLVWKRWKVRNVQVANWQSSKTLCYRKGPYIATQLNWYRRRVELSWVALL